jgi:hypothetical protein
MYMTVLIWSLNHVMATSDGHLPKAMMLHVACHLCVMQVLTAFEFDSIQISAIPKDIL